MKVINSNGIVLSLVIVIGVFFLVQLTQGVITIAQEIDSLHSEPRYVIQNNEKSNTTTSQSIETHSYIVNSSPIIITTFLFDESNTEPTFLEVNFIQEEYIEEEPLTSYDYFEEEIPVFIYYYNINLREDIQYFLWQKSIEYNFCFEMLLAMIFRESSFRTNAVGHNRNGTYDSGLMQVNSGLRGMHLNYFGRRLDLMCPFDNIRGGIFYLNHLRNQYGIGLELTEADMHHLLMAYNMGPTGSRRARANGNLTSQFSRRVMDTRHNIITYGCIFPRDLSL